MAGDPTRAAEPRSSGEKQALREIVAQALADARMAWPTRDGSPVYELFAADVVLDALGLEQVGWRAAVNHDLLTKVEAEQVLLGIYPDHWSERIKNFIEFYQADVSAVDGWRVLNLDPEDVEVLALALADFIATEDEAAADYETEGATEDAVVIRDRLSVARRLVDRLTPPTGRSERS